MGKFVLSEHGGSFSFVLKSGNGRIIAEGRQYTSKKSCLCGIESFRSSASEGEIQDNTLPKSQKPLLCPKFQLFKTENGGFAFRLKARNGNILMESAPYKAKDSALCAIQSLKENLLSSDIVFDE